ncbi:MAG: hypothetical protein IJ769_12875 [Clostridia bacterium]|nr:hypothetical protein [Clostridia bacterium]
MSDKDFQKILEAVPGSYDDFVSYLVRNVTEEENRKKIADFVKDNPEKNAGYVLEFYDDNIWNEDDDYDDDTVFYDDEDVSA